MTAETDPAELYDRRVEELRTRHEVAERRWRRFANVRLVAFVLMAGSVWWMVAVGGEARMVAGLAVAATLAGFGILVRFSSQARATALRLADLRAMNEEGARRVRREWSALEQRTWAAVPVSHPYAVDLDVFGTASLAQLFPALSVAPGRTTLASWLLNAAVPGDLKLRQDAVKQLKDRIELRDELVLHTRRINISGRRLAEFQEWSVSVGAGIEKSWLTVVTSLIPLSVLLLVVAQALGLVAHAYWLVPVALGGIVTMKFRKALRSALGQVQGQRNVLHGYSIVASLILDEALSSSLLADLRAQLGDGATNAARRMRSLERLADCTDVRLSPMLHFVVQALTLWDFHVVRLLDRWRRDCGNSVATWMSAIGTFESVAALATLAYDNPEWVFPTLDVAGLVEVSATALGHPLLDAKHRIPNDVTIGPPGTLVFVTGSNMAGKSTLLRAIGLNVVLAQAGSAVCASSMRCPPVALYTSMRVQDSLERGVSYFMAELERLKLIVDAAHAAHAAQDSGRRTLLYLLDEILHGTNSVERAIAARHVLARLAGLGAIGAVTSHDLQLADTQELAGVANHVHFRENFLRAPDGTPTMHFDYRLRPGKAESSNALKLLELVGLGIGLSGTDSRASAD